jgi:hypothetical protein
MVIIEHITIEDILRFIDRCICRWRCLCCKCPVTDFNLTITVEGEPMASANIGQTVTATVSNIVAGSTPTTPKNPPIYTTSDSTILSLTPASDGMSASGQALKAGTVIVIVTVDTIVKNDTVTVSDNSVTDFTLTITVV